MKFKNWILASHILQNKKLLKLEIFCESNKNIYNFEKHCKIGTQLNQTIYNLINKVSN